MLLFGSSQKKKKKVFWQKMGRSDIEGNWKRRVMGDGCRTRLDLAACVVEQMGLGAAQPGVPRLSSVAPAFRATGAFVLALLAACCGFF